MSTDRIGSHELPNITSFPNEGVEQWWALSDLPASLVLDAQRLQTLRATAPGSWNPTLAAELADLQDRLAPYILNPDEFNKLTATVHEIQVMWNNEIHNFIRNMQDQLRFLGVWQNDRAYVLHNKVSAPVIDGDIRSGNLYIAMANNVPQGSPLPDQGVEANEWWRILSSRGERGAPGFAIDWQGEWQNNRDYTAGQGVRMNGIEFVADVNIPAGVSPASGDVRWQTFQNVIISNTTDRPPNNQLRNGTLIIRRVVAIN